MKKSILVFLMLFSILLGINAATSRTIKVVGTVPQVFEISLSSTTDVPFSLEDTGGTVALPTVNIKSNLKSWVIKAYSSNGSTLKNEDTIPETAIYTFTLGSLFSNITLKNTVPAPADGESGGYKLMTAKTPKAGNDYAMSITYVANAGTEFRAYDKGTFTDTITIAIAAN